jgi:hypothetical protein
MWRETCRCILLVKDWHDVQSGMQHQTGYHYCGVQELWQGNIQSISGQPRLMIGLTNFLWCMIYLRMLESYNSLRNLKLWSAFPCGVYCIEYLNSSLEALAAFGSFIFPMILEVRKLPVYQMLLKWNCI